MCKLTKDWEILLDHVGHPLRECRMRSFYLQGELASRVLTVLLCFDTWIELSTSDGAATVRAIVGQPESYGNSDDEFWYPVLDVAPKDAVRGIYGAALTAVEEIEVDEVSGWLVGFVLTFSSGKTLVVFEDQDEETHLLESTTAIEERHRLRRLV